MLGKPARHNPLRREAPFGSALQTGALSDHVARLQEQGLLTGEQARGWWAELDEQAQAGDFLGGSVMFVVTASKPTGQADGADPA